MRNYAAAVAILLISSQTAGQTPAQEEPEQKEQKIPAVKFRKSRLTRDETESLADKRVLRLTVGEDKTVDLDFDVHSQGEAIMVGKPAILGVIPVDVEGRRRQLTFKPAAEGTTTVSVRDNNANIKLVFDVRVTSSNLSRQMMEIKSLLRDIEGLEMRLVGQKIILDGEILVPADMGRVTQVAKEYGGVILNLTKMSPFALSVVARRIQEDVNTFAPNVRTRVVTGNIFVEGTVDSTAIFEKVGVIAGAYFPSPYELDPFLGVEGQKRVGNPALVKGPLIISLTVNPSPPKQLPKLIRVTVHFVEISKDYSRQFGFKWQPGFASDPSLTIGTGATGATGATGTSFSATINSLFPKLKTAQDAGFARVLKTSSLIVQSAQEASVEDTTQISVPLAAGVGGTAGNKSVDVPFTVTVTPTILGQTDNIELRMFVTQANIIGKASDGSPTTSVHKIKTNLYVKSNESAALGGLQNNVVTTAFNKDDPRPGSFDQSAVPTEPLFSLLRTKSYQKQKNQFVVFVTPQIIESASESSEDLKKNFRIRVQ